MDVVLLRPVVWPRRSIVAAAIVALTLAVGRSAPGASSPRWIVFSALPNGSPPAQLFRVQTTGEGVEQITTGVKPATEPAFSADGTRIVFARLGSGIFRVSLDGTGLRRLTSGIRDAFPTWSPDGKRIAFLRPFRKQWRLYVVPAAGGKARRLGPTPPAGRPTWSANGKSIFIPASGTVARIDSRTGQVQKYYRVTVDPVTGQSATVSPDARWVAYVGSRKPTGPEDCGESQCPQFALYLGGLSTGSRRRIADDTGPAGWSPDSKTLVFVFRGALTLSVVASGARTTVPSGPHVATGDSPPAWQPR
jgi:Tol biopolymer transport system component